MLKTNPSSIVAQDQPCPSQHKPSWISPLLLALLRPGQCELYGRSNRIRFFRRKLLRLAVQHRIFPQRARPSTPRRNRHIWIPLFGCGTGELGQIVTLALENDPSCRLRNDREGRQVLGLGSRDPSWRPCYGMGRRMGTSRMH